MSNYIQHVMVLKLDASIAAEEVVALHAKLDAAGALPEANFLDDMIAPSSAAILGDRIQLPNFDWCSEGSDVDVLLEQVAPHIRGTVHAVLIYEDGTLRGVAVKDGECDEPDVVVSLALQAGFE